MRAVYDLTFGSLKLEGKRADHRCATADANVVGKACRIVATAGVDPCIALAVARLLAKRGVTFPSGAV